MAFGIELGYFLEQLGCFELSELIEHLFCLFQFERVRKCRREGPEPSRKRRSWSPERFQNVSSICFWQNVLITMTLQIFLFRFNLNQLLLRSSFLIRWTRSLPSMYQSFFFIRFSIAEIIRYNFLEPVTRKWVIYVRGKLNQFLLDNRLFKSLKKITFN